MPVRLDWQNQTDFDVDRQKITHHLDLILRRLGRVGMVNIEINMVSEQTITHLNQQFRNVASPTDVLSFPAAESNTPEPLLGSIAVCVPVAERQAKEAGITVADELNSLCGHGLLHLLGYHHR